MPPPALKAIADYLSDDYAEHRYTAAFTADSKAYVENRSRDNANHRMVVHKVLRDGELVFLLVEDSKIDVARGELFRIAGDKIREHCGGTCRR